MKLERYSNQDEVMQGLIVPVYVGVLNWILLGNQYWRNGWVFIIATLLTLAVSLAAWFGNNAAGLYLNRLFPGIDQTITRLLWLLVWCALVGWLCCVFLYGCYHLINSPSLPMQPSRLPWVLLFNLLVVLMVITLYEGIRAFERWERALRETEELKKANLQSQFDSLRSQINPHFLFNSLNTLSSLIEEDPMQAEQFVGEMASVYRYLLRANETLLAALDNELTFAQSYFHLLHTRYGSNIHLEQIIDERFYNYLLPPLTLQLLLENAVKHNVILPEQPLHISIRTEAGNQLVVRNNLQRKKARILSNQVGLTNIATQYRLLGGGDIRVEEDDQFFTVTLPLIRQT
ncbi:sensor histidine kinase [Fibrella forsythiae]|uniref:Histidine kinase n=1 Tax=Fibrella forsythiae TaxID=2817061 RepID=A0ABS3JRG0_9BACT|nr:sensor histidine kinase [Fibrella forsythiae]MBO0952595.1 histidine kinase [Fibrella forsythiae]